MKEISRLLVAYDGSTCADAALEDLKRAGLPEHLETVVMSVAPLVFLPPDNQLSEDEVVSPAAAALVSRQQQKAKRAVRRAHTIAEQGASRVKRDFPGWKVRCLAQGDSPAWAVIKTATSFGADLIVAGTHRHSLVGGRLIMGSVSQRVLYEADCSVRLARCSTQQPEGPVRIVVGFDGSTESGTALNAVALRAWPGGSEVRVVTAGEPLEPGAELESLRAAGLISSEVIRHGDPVHVIIHEADDWGADSIFVGTRSLHGLRHMLQGSVASAVAGRAQCSVEVVRPARNAA